jgi:hypothetical protein
MATTTSLHFTNAFHLQVGQFKVCINWLYVVTKFMYMSYPPGSLSPAFLFGLPCHHLDQLVSHRDGSTGVFPLTVALEFLALSFVSFPSCSSTPGSSYAVVPTAADPFAASNVSGKFEVLLLIGVLTRLPLPLIHTGALLRLRSWSTCADCRTCTRFASRYCALSALPALPRFLGRINEFGFEVGVAPKERLVPRLRLLKGGRLCCRNGDGVRGREARISWSDS